MRNLTIAAAVLAVAPQLTFADTFTADANVTAVTVYHGAANVTREMSVDLPVGNHAIIVPNLPAQLRADFVEIKADGTVTLGAMNLATGRLAVAAAKETAAIAAAQGEVDRLQEALRLSDVAIAQIRLKAQAAEEQIAFLRGQTVTTTDPDDVSAVQALADMVGAEVLVLRQTAFAAEQEALAAERAQAADHIALAKAEQALAALKEPPMDTATLTFFVDVAEAATINFDIVSIEGEASWAPVYDLRLTTDETPTLQIERDVVISQSTGQDWNDVVLTLSTAQPSGRVSPYRANGQLASIISDGDFLRLQNEDRVEYAGLAPAIAEAPVLAAETPSVSLSRRTPDGIATSYDYPRTVSIRNGVEDLRLPLDTLTYDATQRARAVPAKENAAYRMVKFTNGDDILLEGNARYYANGVIVGIDSLRTIPAGQTAEIGFGAIQGLLTKRNAPNRSAGSVGIITQENQQDEAVTLTIQNLTQEDWRVQVMDGAPYSEQTGLEVTYTSTPQHTLLQRGGQRGVLEWMLDLSAGEEQDISVDYQLTWPNGFRLQ